MKFDWNAILDVVVNKFHTPIAVMWAIALLIYKWHSGQEITPGLQNTTYALYGFLGVHAGIYQKWPDVPLPTGTTSNGN